MSIELLVQILGGLTGIAVAYAMHRFVERPYERSTAEARIKFEEEMEKLRKKKQALTRLASATMKMQLPLYVKKSSARY